MKDIRIVFMGTPDFAVTILKHLVENKYAVVGVITAPDRPAGRGRKINESAVKKYAVSQNLPVLQPTNLKNEDFHTALKKLNANLQIVVAFRMLPKVVWKMPQFGTFNLHASLLPSYRGAAPIHWAIINGETITGATTFFIDDKIDTGAIILQETIAVSNDETVGTLHDKLMFLGANLVAKTINLIAKGDVRTLKQPELEEKSAPKLNPDNCKIDWTASLDIIYNKIRGLNPFHKK
jgi:methionyl-tRNA formyltransferase